MNVSEDFLARLQLLTEEAENHNLAVYGVLCSLMGTILSENEINLCFALNEFNENELKRINVLQNRN